MSKYLLKFIKYILPSSKYWTGFGLLNYRDGCRLSTSISRENIDIVILSIELVLNSLMQQQTPTTTLKEPPVMRVFWAFVKKPELDC
jgi:hypothetical protein